MKKKKKDNKKIKEILKKIGKFFNDPRPIIIVLIIICFLLIIAFSNYKSKFKVYTGEFVSDEVGIRAVHIYMHPNINTFYASAAEYLGEDKKVYEYKIGYYYQTKDGLKVFKESSDQGLNTPVDLKDIVSKLSYINYSESTTSESNLFTRDVVNNLGKLHFVILASTTKDEDDGYDIEIDCPINFTSF